MLLLMLMMRMMRMRTMRMMRMRPTVHLERRKLYISMGWMETVKDFSIFVPSYIRVSDICFSSELVEVRG